MSFNNFVENLKRIAKGKSFRYGLPFVSLVVVGSFGLSEFTSVVVSKREENNRRLTVDEALAATGVGPRKVDLEEEFKKMQKELDINDWENVRGPRPWEEPQPQAPPKYKLGKKDTSP